MRAVARATGDENGTLIVTGHKRARQVRGISKSAYQLEPRVSDAPRFG